MRGSQFDLLRVPEIVVLAAGHGGADPGNVWGGHREADETIILTDIIAANLRGKGLRVEVVPHGEALGGAIRHVNARFAAGQAWAVDIHRDSADSITPGSPDANGRCGIYYGNTEQSRLIGQFVRRVFLREGAHQTSWARIHTDSPRRRLGWIVHTNPVAHILELGSYRAAGAASTWSGSRVWPRSPSTKPSPARGLIRTRCPSPRCRAC